MSYSSFSESLNADNIVDVILNNGEKVKCKKFSRKIFEGMETFLPEMKNLSFLVPETLDYIAKCGETPLFVANGNYKKFMQSPDGKIFYSAQMSKEGGIEKQKGFTKSEYTKEGMKAASNAAKAIPWIGLAITVIEVGVNIVKHEKAIKAEESKFYLGKLEELAEQYDLLWNAMIDYTTFVSNDQMRTAYLSNFVKAFSVANSKFNEMKTISENAKVIDEYTVQTMNAAVIVYSMASLLKILYAKTDCREYIERSVESINKMTEDFNLISEKAYAQNKEKIDKNYKKATVAERVFGNNFKDPAAKTAFAIFSGGASLLTGWGTDKIDEKIVNKNEEKLNRISSLKIEENPFLKCLNNLDLITAADNLVLFDDEYLYYQIPEKCTL